MRREPTEVKLLGFLGALTLSLAASDASAASYICEANAEYEVGRGTLERNDQWIKLSRRLVFDEETCVLTRDRMEPFQMIVFQKGTKENGVIAAIHFRGPASFVFMSLRIRTYEDPVSFIFDDGGSLITGVCERIGK
jgi:hypothetical protein